MHSVVESVFSPCRKHLQTAQRDDFAGGGGGRYQCWCCSGGKQKGSMLV